MVSTASRCNGAFEGMVAILWNMGAACRFHPLRGSTDVHTDEYNYVDGISECFKAKITQGMGGLQADQRSGSAANSGEGCFITTAYSPSSDKKARPNSISMCDTSYTLQLAK